MSNYGIKISRPGESVWNSDPRKHVFWSKNHLLGTYLVGTHRKTFSSDVSSYTFSVNHNLGFRPLCWLNIIGPGASTRQTTDWWAEWYSSGGNTALRAWTKEVSTSQFKIVYSESNIQGSGVNPSGETWDFKYYIFIEGNV